MMYTIFIEIRYDVYLGAREVGCVDPGMYGLASETPLKTFNRLLCLERASSIGSKSSDLSCRWSNRKLRKRGRALDAIFAADMMPRKDEPKLALKKSTPNKKEIVFGCSLRMFRRILHDFRGLQSIFKHGRAIWVRKKHRHRVKRPMR